MQVHTFKKARAAVYPSAVQNGIVWFWPNTDPQFKDILMNKRPPYIPELDDLSYTKSKGARDFPFGYVEIQLSTSSIILFFPNRNIVFNLVSKGRKELGGVLMPVEVMKCERIFIKHK